MREARELAQLVGLLETTGEIRDRNPGRDGVTQLDHAFQCAARAEAAGADDELIACALLHDAAKPLTEVFHGQAVAEILRERVSVERRDLLRSHGRYQALLLAGREPRGGEAWEFASWDAASFDPTTQPPGLDHWFPLIERLYGAKG